MRLEVRLDESQTAAVGGPVEVALDGNGAADDVWIAAQVGETSRVDAGSHSFLVKVELPAATHARSGTFGRARFSGAARDVLTVPRSAVVFQGQLPTVFVVSSGRARMRVIRVGEMQDEIEVTAGVAAGEPVITSPPPSLRDGDPVATAPAPAAGGR
jgi:hypothetical protein